MNRLLVSAAITFFVVACSAAPEDGETQGDTTSNQTKTVKAAELPAADACVPCTEQFAEGAAQYDKLRRACYCTEDACGSACSTTQCARPTSLAPNEACDTCIEEATACTRKVQSSCEANDDCRRYVLCKLDSSCN